MNSALQGVHLLDV